MIVHGLLLAAGADPAIADADGVTALQHAEQRGFDGIVTLLEGHHGNDA